MSRATVILLVALALGVAGCGDDEPAGVASTTVTETSGGSPDDGCRAVDKPEARDDGGLSAPNERLDVELTYILVFATSCGSFTVTLDQAGAPATAASLVSLARHGYFDGTIFHRIVPGFVIQGGDPTQSGEGGPGYQTVDAPPPDASYVRGVVAMAKTQSEAAGTSGSQFFVVTGVDIGLPPEYAIVGKVTNGLRVVERIGALGDPATEEPTQPVAIERVAVRESG